MRIATAAVYSILFASLPIVGDSAEFGKLQAKPAPIAIVGERVFDFKEVKQGQSCRHTFWILNAGSSVLRLGPVETSCRCVAVLSRDELAPRETGAVTLEWQSLHLGEFRQSATIPTNDPKHPSIEFVLRGTGLVPWRLNPQSISIYGLAVNESKEATTDLLIYDEEKCDIVGHEWGDKKKADLFNLIHRPLTPAELAKLSPTPKSGHRLTIIAPKGMPVGPLVQTVTLKTTLATETPILMAIYGHVSPDIILIGPHEFNARAGTLQLGEVPQGTERRIDMSLLLTGEHRKSTTYKVTKVVPEILQVTLGEPKENAGGGSLRVPLQIVLPATAKPQSWLSAKPEEMGRIVIETTHPDYRELTILVRGAVVEPKAAPPVK